jgi:hypothetical protein
MGRWLRNMRTTQEIRQTRADEREGLPVRKARLSLPTAWDDFWRYSQRTWKKHRQSQYKLLNLADATKNPTKEQP